MEINGSFFERTWNRVV